jgi:hypothetical protein
MLVISQIILFLNTETIVTLLNIKLVVFMLTVSCTQLKHAVLYYEVYAPERVIYCDPQTTVPTGIQKYKIEMEGHNVTHPKQCLHCISQKCSTEQSNTEQCNRYLLTTATEQFCYLILIVRAMIKVI